MKKVALLLLLFSACSTPEKKSGNSIKLISLDPGHFHAALVQKSMLPNVDSTVYVYAPDGQEVTAHLNRIRAYNTRTDNPTRWNEQVYLGPDFLDKLLAEKAGNVVVISGNNLKKTEYIDKCIDAGLNVLADKPMAINKANFEILKSDFDKARKNNVLLYDIMTERYEITNLLQREFSMIPELFGKLETGSVEKPSVIKASVHHFYKQVSGQTLVRPAWFMDVSQQGEGLTDITTHLVDLVQWACFPEQTLDYTKDIELIGASRWPTSITRSQFSNVTRLPDFPDYLKKDIVQDSVLQVFSNGEINYRIKGVHARVSVIWAYEAPPGTGDTHYSIMMGSLSNLIIRQGADQQYKATLYIEPVSAKDASFEAMIHVQIKKVAEKFPGLTVKRSGDGWEVIIPEEYKDGHEAHFSKVTAKYLGFLAARSLPEWEVPNMIAKYYTTTRAREIAKTISSK